MLDFALAFRLLGHAAGTDHQQWQAVGVECVDCQIGALVRHHLTDPQIMVIEFDGWREQARLDRRVDDLRVAPPDLFDPLLDESRVGGKLINSGARTNIPLPQLVINRRHDKPGQQVRLSLVLVIVIPDVAHG